VLFEASAPPVTFGRGHPGRRRRGRAVQFQPVTVTVK
jgi:hypothetical protein